MRLHLLFLFDWLADHPDLHSFPTRRSSDLGLTTARHTTYAPAPSAQSPRYPWRDGCASSPSENCRRQSYETQDRKSTRLNSSHVRISYAVFCLKKKNWTKWLRWALLGPRVL